MSFNDIRGSLFIMSISALPARPRAPLVARVAHGRVDGRQGTRVRCSIRLISHTEPAFSSMRRCLALKTLARDVHVVKICFRRARKCTVSPPYWVIVMTIRTRHSSTSIPVVFTDPDGLANHLL